MQLRLSRMFVALQMASASFPFRDPKLPWDQRVDDLVSRLTLAEKVGQMSHGGAASNSPTPPIQRLGIQPYQWGTECISGDVYAGPATSFPMSINMASTFDAPLLKRTSRATGLEVRAKNNDAVRRGVRMFHTGLSCWSPVINIARHPLWGRNQETYGEDPLLNGAMGAAFVAGLQGDATERYLLTNAGCKHFAAFAGPLNSNGNHVISERDLQTTYLPQFKMCVEAEWGFPGYVVSDQTALEQIAGTYSPGWPGYQPAGYAPYNKSTATAAALIALAGCDLEDSNWNVSGIGGKSNIFASLTRSVAQGLISESQIDVAVRRLFAVRFRLGEFDPPNMTHKYTSLPLNIVQSKEHVDLALEAAQKSIVLLKNQARDEGRGATLPLSAALVRGRKIALIGPFADAAVNHSSKETTGKCSGRGALYFGDYSAGPFQPYWKMGPGPWADQPTARNLTVTVHEALAMKAAELGASLHVAAGCATHCPAGGGGSPRSTVCTESSYDRASVARATAEADVTIVCVGTSTLVEAEGIDRVDLALPGAQGHLLRHAIEGAAASNGTLVVVLFAAGGVDVSEAVDSSAVGAILNAGYPGQTAGHAVVSALFGDTVPAGRLAVTWPRALTQVPHIGEYSMLHSTYRYSQPDPLFPFGFGLSYTSFKYSALSVSPPAPQTCETVQVHVTVSNTGGIDADEVVMAFVEWVHAPQDTPERTLVAFARVHIAAGRDVRVSLELPPSRLAVLHVPGLGSASSTWMADPVGLQLFVGGQQPGMKVSAPSNVVSTAFDVEGAGKPLAQCN